MAWVALNCPQCSAPLPRVAIWRSVKCAACGALITKTESVVERDSFRQAWKRAQQNLSGLDNLLCSGGCYHLMHDLGVGEISQVYLAQRIGPMPLLVTIKLSSVSTAAARYSREAQTLRNLQALDNEGAGAYFSKLLPEVIAQGVVDGTNGKQGLVLRHPTGFWGSLAALNEHFPQGIDPRHAVWIWRRMLEVLNFIHNCGWSHGEVRPEHALVHPQDHGIRLIGWANAVNGAGIEDKATDLLRSARVMQVLLSGMNGSGALPDGVPTGLAKLIDQASTDESFCRTQGAAGLETLLREEARAAFGSPSFVPLII